MSRCKTIVQRKIDGGEHAFSIESTYVEDGTCDNESDGDDGLCAKHRRRKQAAEQKRRLKAAVIRKEPQP